MRRKAAENKNISIDISKLIEVDEKRRELQQEVEDFRMQKNQINEKIKKGEKLTTEDLLIMQGLK